MEIWAVTRALKKFPSESFDTGVESSTSHSSPATVAGRLVFGRERFDLVQEVHFIFVLLHLLTTLQVALKSGVHDSPTLIDFIGACIRYS